MAAATARCPSLPLPVSPMATNFATVGTAPLLPPWLDETGRDEEPTTPEEDPPPPALLETPAVDVPAAVLLERGASLVAVGALDDPTTAPEEPPTVEDALPPPDEDVVSSVVGV